MSLMVAEVFRAFKAANVDDETATAAASAVLAEIATKTDLHATAADLGAELAAVRGDLRGEMAQLRTEMAQLRTDIATAIQRQTTWMVSAMVVLTGIYAGIATALKLWVK